MRAGGKRTWLKLYPYQCIEGSIRYQLEPSERSVWYDLLCFAALCSNPGIIADTDLRPYPHQFIANRLNIPIELLEDTLKKCIKEGRITDEIGILKITNWAAYQSEYQRQKPYRQKERSGKKIHKLCPGCGWKGLTDEVYCPSCSHENKDTELKKDYEGGKHGHMVQR